MGGYRIRTFGDPVLKRRAQEVTEIDGRLAALADAMVVTMHEARGLGLAAPQVGIGRRLFVYEIGDSGPCTIVNPEIVESDGEWEYEEGCLSLPGLFFPIVRAKRVHVRGYDLDGGEVSIEAADLQAKLFQHELDHLDGKLLLEMLDEDQRKAAMKELRRRAEIAGDPASSGPGAAPGHRAPR